MQPATLTLLPDDLTGAIRVLRVEADGQTVEAQTSLSRIQSGEDGFEASSARRYEMPKHPNSEPADLAARRVVLADGGLSGLERMPIWARQQVALHPDRHDLARWLRAARGQSDAPWVSHLPVILRDALRAFDQHHPLTLIVPDRAYLAATNDDNDTVAGITEAFTAPAFGIDAACHRTGEELAPMPLANDALREQRSGLVTRAQTVIAEALMNGHDARTLPSVHDIEARWLAVVDSDHAKRLRKVAQNEWVAPLAILDDHRDPNFRATLILATAHIVLSKTGRDVWIEYHEAVEVVANRPLAFDLAGRLRVGSDANMANRNALLACLHAGALPVLEISTRPDGEFDNRQLMQSIPDAVPLLRDHPGYSFPDAVLAFQRFRTSPVDVEQKPTAGLISRLVGRGKNVAEGNGGESDLNGAGSDKQVAEQTDMPPEQEIASEVEPIVGETDNAHDKDEAHDTPDQPQGQNDAPVATQVDDDGDIPETGLPLTGGEFDGVERVEGGGEGEEGTGEQGGDSATGAGQLRATSPSVGAKDVAHSIARALGNDVPAEGNGGESDLNGAGSDKQVAEQTDMPPEQEIASEVEPIVGETDNAHDKDEGSRKEWLAKLLDRMTDTDAQHVRDVRSRVEQAKAKRSGPAGLLVLPADEVLRTHGTLVSKVMQRTESQTLHTQRATTRKQVETLRALYETEAVWLRLLLALNLAGVIEREGLTGMGSVTIPKVVLAAEQAFSQTAVAKIAVPAPDRADKQRGNDMPSSGTGGMRG